MRREREQERRQAQPRHGQRGLLGVEVPDAVAQRLARSDVDPLVGRERGRERREREDEEGRHSPHALRGRT